MTLADCGSMLSWVGTFNDYPNPIPAGASGSIFSVKTANSYAMSNNVVYCPITSY